MINIKSLVIIIATAIKQNQLFLLIINIVLINADVKLLNYHCCFHVDKWKLESKFTYKIKWILLLAGSVIK